MDVKKKTEKKWYQKFPKLVVAPIAAVVLLGFVVAWLWLVPHGQRIDPKSYQVVYLSSGQAYFGKLQNTSGEYLELKNAYVIQDVKPAADAKKSAAIAQTTLVKVEDQVYGPENSMALRSSNVLFWQNLRSDSKVTQAIKAKE